MEPAQAYARADTCLAGTQCRQGNGDLETGAAKDARKTLSPTRYNLTFQFHLLQPMIQGN